MGQYSIDDYVFWSKFYLCQQKPAEILRKLFSALKNWPKSSPITLSELIAKFKRTGSLADDREACRPNKRFQNNGFPQHSTINAQDLDRKDYGDHAIARSFPNPFHEELAYKHALAPNFFS